MKSIFIHSVILPFLQNQKAVFEKLCSTINPTLKEYYSQFNNPNVKKLYDAVAKNDIDEIKKILDEAPELVNCRHENKNIFQFIKSQETLNVLIAYGLILDSYNGSVNLWNKKFVLQ